MSCRGAARTRWAELRARLAPPERERSQAPSPPDLRLAAAALGAWLAAAGSLFLPAGAAGAAAALAAAVASLLGWRYRREPPASNGDASVRHGPRPARHLLGAVVALVGGAALGGAVTALRVAERDAAPVAAAVARGARAQAELVVRDDPRPLAGAAGSATYLVPAHLTSARLDTGDTLRLRVAVVVFGRHPSWGALLPGQRVRVAVRFGRARPGDLTAASLVAAEPPEQVSRPPWVQRVAGQLREGLRAACRPLPPEPGGLLPGLVLGDTSRLPPALAADFRATGMTHLLAVSGSNVAIVLAAVLLLGRWCRAGPRGCALLCLVALVGFVILVRPSPSVLRAGLMGAIGVLALATGRRRAAVPALAATVAGLVVVDPALAVQPGFILSVVATAALILVAPRWRDHLRRRGVPAGLAEAIAVPAAAAMACGPVIAALAGTVNPVSVVANLLAAPAVAPATVLGVLAAVIGPVAPAGAEFLAALAGWPARWLVGVATVGARVPGAVLPWPAGILGAGLLAAAIAALVVAGRHAVVRRTVAVCTVAAVLGAVPVRLAAGGWPPAGWLIVACDVGQGDALVLPAGGRDAIVVDAGPEPAAVDRCLRALGVRRVCLLVLSHVHLDHTGGVAGVGRGRPVDAVVAPAPSGPTADGRQIAGALGVPVRTPAPGWAYAAGPARLTVLGPAAPLHGTRSDINNNSLVLSAEVSGVRMLLTGDAEAERQRELLAHPPPGGLAAQVLKIAHHGSAYQEPSFLEAIRPAVALVSVGEGNRYGHPHPSVLHHLRRGGARVLRTDMEGDLAVTGYQGRLAVAVRGRPVGTR